MQPAFCFSALPTQRPGAPHSGARREPQRQLDGGACPVKKERPAHSISTGQTGQEINPFHCHPPRPQGKVGAPFTGTRDDKVGGWLEPVKRSPSFPTKANLPRNHESFRQEKFLSGVSPP